MSKKIIIILTFLLSISSCKWLTEADTSELAFTNIKIPAGTPKFQLGYKDGCSSVLYTRGNGLYRSRYAYEFHPELIDDEEYFFGRKRGYSFCFNYITGPAGHFAKGWDGYIYAQGTPFDMGAGTIDDTVIGRASGTYGGKANSVWDTFGDMKGGLDGSIGVLTRNRANTGGVLGGSMFYGQTSAQQNQILGF